MTTPQRLILLAGIIIVALLLLFPPWYSIGPGLFGEMKYHIGYRYLNAAGRGAIHIDLVRWLWPVGAVCLLTLLGYLELGGPRKG